MFKGSVGIRLVHVLVNFCLIENARYIGIYLEGRSPFLELHLPVEHHGSRDNDEMGAPDVFVARQM